MTPDRQSTARMSAAVCAAALLAAAASAQDCAKPQEMGSLFMTNCPPLASPGYGHSAGSSLSAHRYADGSKWGSLTNNGGQPDQMAGATGDTHRAESIVRTAAKTGFNAWHFKRGYDSPGVGTPLTPPLLTCPAGTFSFEVSFKAAQPGDQSRIHIGPAPAGGTDRSSTYLEMFNDAEALVLRHYKHNGDGVWEGHYETLAVLDASEWHTLRCTARDDPDESDPANLAAHCDVDGGKHTFEVDAYFARARRAGGWDYVPSCRLKFQPRHSNHAASFQGFYFDDVSTTKSDKDGHAVASFSTSFEPESHAPGSECAVWCVDEPEQNRTLTCGSDGEWAGQSVACFAGACPNGALRVRQERTTDDQCGSCDPRYYLDAEARCKVCQSGFFCPGGESAPSVPCLQAARPCGAGTPTMVFDAADDVSAAVVELSGLIDALAAEANVTAEHLGGMLDNRAASAAALDSALSY